MAGFYTYPEHTPLREAYHAELARQFQQDVKNQAKEAVKLYLAHNGDAVDQRVLASIAEAKALLEHKHFGPALCAAAIAVELMIRYMLIRPLLQGAFLSDEWAGILTDRIVTDKAGRDSDLVPIVLRQWGLDVTSVRSGSWVSGSNSTKTYGSENSASRRLEQVLVNTEDPVKTYSVHPCRRLLYYPGILRDAQDISAQYFNALK